MRFEQEDILEFLNDGKSYLHTDQHQTDKTQSIERNLN